MQNDDRRPAAEPNTAADATRITAGCTEPVSESISRPGPEERGSAEIASTCSYATGETIEKIEGRWEIEWDSRRLAIYHDLRADFLSWLDRIVTFVVLVLTSGVFVTLIAGLDGTTLKLVAAVPAVLSLLSFSFRFGEMAHKHATSYSEYMGVLRQAERDDMSIEEIRALKARLNETMTRAPSAKHKFALDAVAHNLCCDHYGADARLHVGWFKRLFKNWFSFSTASFRPIS
ncbi:MAG: hypothetical protein NXH95_13535 [Pseudomonadaceae bacterium]|nr:hypothetical protein [Pseudomonadaceae bacterium]